MKFPTAFKQYIAFVSIVALGSLFFQSPLSAQSDTKAAQALTPAAQAAAPMPVTVKKLGFRLSQWETIHTRNAEEAQKEIDTLKRLGCEVASETHGDHIDVRYHCPEWKSIKLASDQLVTQWASWCQAKGMETVILQPPASTQGLTVRFRLANPRTIHLHNEVEAKQIVNTLELVGCSVATNKHNDHMDATFSCPQWMTIELPTQAAAQSWQKWFQDSGFELLLSQLVPNHVAETQGLDPRR